MSGEKSALVLINKASDIKDEISKISARISEAYVKLKNGSNAQHVNTVNGDYQYKKMLNQLKEDENVYDNLFVEEEKHRQLMGGKSRKQTLQEFVLTFFYVAYFVLTLSLTLKNGLVGGFIEALKIFMVLLLILILITITLIRYA